MDAERWKQIKEVYDRALDLRDDERAGFFAEACGDDDDLHREVESLLAAHEDAGTFLQAPAVEVAAREIIADEDISPAPQLIGRELASYRIVSLLGRGGMGEVYSARDTRLNRMVALKILPARVATDQDRMRRFMREAKAASALKHPNVATIYDIGKHDGTSFIAMEYIEGQTLAAKISGHPLDVGEIVEITIQVADALGEAQSKGVTHRDIKPANIMLTPRGQVKVLDFGLAKITRHEWQAGSSDISTASSTEMGVVMGTAPYMSPEQALGQEVDHRSDIFSLGVLTYEMTAGCRPFTGASATEIIDRILHAQPEPIARFNEHAPAELERIVNRCLEKERERRYQSAGELLPDLTKLKRELESGTAVTVVVSRKRERRRRAAGRLLAISTLVALVAGLLALALTQPWRSRKSQETKTGATVSALAVLPFKPIGAGDDEYLGLGMADALITKLSNIRELNIRPTSTMRKYSAPGQDPVAAGRELRVEAVLEGSVQRVAERIRVTVQLVSVRDGAPLWTEKFDEHFTNIFAVQDRIAEQVARALTLSLSSAEQERLTKRYTENSATYQLYLKGRYFWNKRTVEGLKKGIGYFNEAIEKDPSYALAYVGLADSYSLLSDYQGLPPQEVYPQAKKAALQALALDDQLAEAHATLAFIKTTYDWDWPGAEREYRRAIELNPNYETARQWYAEYLSGMGRHEEAIAEIKRARAINPVALIINAVEVWVLYHARQYDQAIAQGQKVVEMDPHFAEVYEYLKRSYDQKGMYKEAIAARQMRRRLGGFDAKETAALRQAAAATSARVYWRKRLEQEIEESKRESNTAFDLAEIYAQLGEKDRAFAWLEKAYEERYFTMMYLKVVPNLDPLRSDPRFTDLLRRVGHTP